MYELDIKEIIEKLYINDDISYTGETYKYTITERGIIALFEAGALSVSKQCKLSTSLTGNPT